MKRAKVAIASNTVWSIVNFRGGLVRALMDAGYEVVAMASPDEHVPRLSELGCRYLPLPIDGQGTNPGHDLLLLWRYWRLLQSERPDFYLAFTVKPNIYGSLAARALGIPAINVVTGLGTAFARSNWLRILATGLYRLALARSEKVFFQNQDDRQLFVQKGLVQLQETTRVRGSGVDLKRFELTPFPDDKSRFRFLLISRMLWDKGVGEYVEAARIVKQAFRNVEFCLLGPLNPRSPSAISNGQMEAWRSEDVVRYLGVSSDVRGEVATADCIVLPSYYREGVPRALLEAAAMGRPIIATDAPGCREAVNDGTTGFLCRTRDANDLAEKMKRMLALSERERVEMGRRGREKMEREFDEKIVIDHYIEIISSLLERRRSSARVVHP